MLSVAYLRERFAYDPETGVLTWRSGQNKGKPIVSKDKKYLRVILNFEGRQYGLFAHRIAFALMTGAWPANEIDHHNGIGHDNRWDNLREATHRQNKQNLGGPMRSGSSGLLGVSPSRHRWKASIKTNGKQKHLGYFPTKEEAYQAYLAAKAKVHPFGVRLNG